MGGRGVGGRGMTYRPPLSVVLKRSWPVTLIGVLLILVSLAVMFDNERSAVTVTHALEDGYNNILVIPDTTAVVFEENNGKLVLVAGELVVQDNLEDPTYGVAIPAVKLKKTAQMFQWYETEDARQEVIHEGDHDAHVEATYSYATDWFDRRINSEMFHNTMGHHNPEYWPVNSSLSVSPRVKVGNFLLGKELKALFNTFTPFTSDQRPEHPNIKMHAGLYFHAKNVWQPDVGDVRVQFSYAGKHGDTVTVVGKQSGREIKPYTADTATGSQKELLFLYFGHRTAEDIFQSEHAQNRIKTWAVRLAAWLACFIGLNCISTILEMIVDDYPYIRSVLVMRITSIPFSLSISLMLLTTGVSWTLYRPLWGLMMLGIALTPITMAVYKIQQRKKAQNKQRL